MICPTCSIPMYCINGKEVDGKLVQTFQCPKCKKIDHINHEIQLEGGETHE